MARAQAQRRRRAAAPARKSARSAEDLMFFPKLRRRAKWVFAFLALAFGIGFVAFGVGTGVSGTSLGDGCISTWGIPRRAGCLFTFISTGFTGACTI